MSSGGAQTPTTGNTDESASRLYLKPPQEIRTMSDEQRSSFAEALYAALMAQMDPDGSKQEAARTRQARKSATEESLED